MQPSNKANYEKQNKRRYGIIIIMDILPPGGHPIQD